MTGLSGVASVCAAALISYTVLSRCVNSLLSLSVGMMLAIALLHSLPEAFESGAAPAQLFALLLAGLLTFFFIEKWSLLRHARLADQAGHGAADHGHRHGAHHHGGSGWVVLVGDSLHNFTDGILIAAAFLADPHLGLLTGLAIVAHEIPQEIGDFVVLLHAGYGRRRAFALNIASSLTAVAGGLLGYLTLSHASALIPYVLVLASSGFIYIAISDLMPQMQRRTGVREALAQVALIGAGITLVVALTGHEAPHAHAPDARQERDAAPHGHAPHD